MTTTGWTAPDQLTVDQACALVQVSRRTIYNWLKQGKLQVTRTAGGRLRIQRESLWQAPGALTEDHP